MAVLVTPAVPNDLTSAERDFLVKHGISIEEVIIVGDLIPVGMRRSMEVRGARVAISNRRCRQGHRLKMRSGHCPICRPAGLAYERRHSESAHVYICRSRTGLIKIGYAADVRDREQRLNREAFANCTDWRLVFHLKVPRAGKVEACAHAYLERYASAETYQKGGVEITSREVFVCSVDEAIKAVERAAADLSG